MIESRSHLIRAGHGQLRVLRLAADGAQLALHRYRAHTGSGTCRLCGCTDAYGCIGGCGWVNRRMTLCSRCYERRLR